MPSNPGTEHHGNNNWPLPRGHDVMEMLCNVNLTISEYRLSLSRYRRASQSQTASSDNAEPGGEIRWVNRPPSRDVGIVFGPSLSAVKGKKHGKERSERLAIYRIHVISYTRYNFQCRPPVCPQMPNKTQRIKSMYYAPKSS